MTDVRQHLEADREETIVLDIGAAAKPVVVDKMPSAEKAEMERFMQEKVRIYLEAPANDHEEQVVFVSVNDRPKWLRRGCEHVIERCYLENLIRARQVMYSARIGNVINSQTGMSEPGTIYNRAPKMLYPFTPVEDSERGMKWYRSLTAQAVV